MGTLAQGAINESVVSRPTGTGGRGGVSQGHSLMGAGRDAVSGRPCHQSVTLPGRWGWDITAYRAFFPP